MSTMTVATINGTHFETINDSNRDTLAVDDEIMIRLPETGENELHEITDETRTQWIIETGARYSKLTGEQIGATTDAYILGRAAASERQHVTIGDLRPADIVELSGERVDVISTARTIDKQFVHVTWKTIADGLVMSDRFAASAPVVRHVRKF